MHKATRAPVFAALICLTLAACGPRYDLVIRNGDVLDGSGSPPRKADVAIKGDRIAAIGSVADRGRQEIDAAGQTVSPGFIDVQGQSGVTLLVDGNGESHVRQGITTEVIGEGGTPALWTDQNRDDPAIKQYGLKFDWTGFDGYLRRLQQTGTSINLGSFAPVAMLRQQVVGMADRP